MKIQWEHYQVRLLKRAIRHDLVIVLAMLVGLVGWIAYDTAVPLVVEAFLAGVFSIVNACYHAASLIEVREKFHLRNPAENGLPRSETES